jgi:hypothetical protein
MQSVEESDDATRKLQDFVRRQTSVHVGAHKSAIGIKPLGYKLGQEGIDQTKFYVNPKFLPLPLDRCDYLNQLSPAQLSVLTALYYASLYRAVMSAEKQVITYNMKTADRNFRRYSDDYMVLFHETDEEHDHISSFRPFVLKFLGSLDLLDEKNTFEGWPFDRILDSRDARLGPEGYGALFLLYRFLANVVLKQVEGFMMTGVSPSEVHPLAHELNQAHVTDEARHFSTSFEMGMGLLRRATREDRKHVRHLLAGLAYIVVEGRFGTDPERRLDLTSYADFALEQALRRPDFAVNGEHLTLGALKLRWKAQGISYREPEAYTAGMRWHAKQLHRLFEAADIRLPKRSVAVERMEGLARPS